MGTVQQRALLISDRVQLEHPRDLPRPEPDQRRARIRSVPRIRAALQPLRDARSPAPLPALIEDKTPGNVGEAFPLLLCQGRGVHGVVDGADELAFEAADGFSFGFALGEFGLGVGLGWWVVG